MNNQIDEASQSRGILPTKTPPTESDVVPSLRDPAKGPEALIPPQRLHGGEGDLPELESRGQGDLPELESRWQRLIRDVATGNVIISILAIVLSLTAGAILIGITNQRVLSAASYFLARPGDFLSAMVEAVGGAYLALFNSAIYNLNAPDFATGIQSLTSSLATATPFIAAGLGIAISFRVGLFNIGGQGQMLIAAAAAGLVAFDLQLPPVLHFFVATLAALGGGAIWAGLAGLLKARTGAHEVIVTIMLNYIALYFINFLLKTPVLQAPGSTNPLTPSPLPTSKFPTLAGPVYGLDLGFVLVIVAAVLVWWLLDRSSLGFKFRVVGENPRAASVAGINVKRTYFWALALSGGLVGLGAATQVLGTSLLGGFGSSVDNGIGFMAITVALLGRSRPLGVVIAGILLGVLQNGGASMQTAMNVPIDVVTVIQSLIVLFVAAPPLVRAIFLLNRSKRRTTARAFQSSKEVTAR